MARKSRKHIEPETPVTTAVYIRTAAYIRLSVEDNNNRGNSLENQQLIITDFLADKPEYKIIEVYTDNGLSGTDYNRPAFQRMLVDIEAEKIDCVIVKDLSRLGRNFIDTSYYIEQYFFTHHIRFIAVTDQYDTGAADQGHGSIMLPLKNMINEAYALDIGRKVRATHHQAMLDGKFVSGRAPYGYRKAPDDCHKLIVDEVTAPAVRQMFQWAYEGMSLTGMVKRLNASEYLPPAFYKLQTGEIKSKRIAGNGKWQEQSIRQVLENPVYTGDMVQGKTRVVDHRKLHIDKDEYIIVENTHEALVSHEMFEAVQRIRKETWESIQGKVTSPYNTNLFLGKIYCADCGKRLQRQRQKGKQQPDVYSFYCCNLDCIPNQHRRAKRIRENDLIEILTELLEKELSLSQGKSITASYLEAKQQERRQEITVRLTEQKSILAKNQQILQGLYEDLAQGLLDQHEYKMMKADFEGRVIAANREIGDLQASMKEMEQEINRFREVEKDASQFLRKKKLTQIVLDKLVSRIEISHDQQVQVQLAFRNTFVNGRTAAYE